ncbi:MAG: tRNA pseudouridine(38-40) synthase TruA [Opitutaceae bacterium]
MFRHSQEKNPQVVDPRWKCVCAYDGTAFAGWQSQVKGNAIQDVIEAQLARILGRPVRTHASGRTDAGVHARGQVFHFDAAWRHGGAKLVAALSSGLPPTIQIKSAREVARDFHSRFSALGKIYSYHLYLGDPDPFSRPFCWGRLHDLDLRAMKEAAALLRGKRDFRAFSAFNGAEQEDTVRNLRRLDVTTCGRRIKITAEADGFLYKMVRRLVGAIVAAGQGKLSPERIKTLLASGERTSDLHTAPPQGLYLNKVLY